MVDKTVHEYPFLYICAMNITGIFGGSINFFAIYLIVWVSPKTMKNYRYFILFYQISSTLFELLLHFVTVEVYFPALSCRMYGFLYEIFHIHVTILFGIGLFLFLNGLLATVQCFIYRHRLVLPKDHWLRFSLHNWVLILAFHYFLFLFIFFICILRLPLEHPPNAQGLEKLLEDYPEYSFLGTDGNAWIAYINQPIFPPILNFSSVLALEIIIPVFATEWLLFSISIVIHSIYLLESPLIHMSAKTKQLHKKLIYSLFVQIMIPFFSVTGPLALFVFLATTGKIVDQIWLNGSAILVSSHANLSSILIFAFTEPYRVYILKGIKRIFKKGSVGHLKVASHSNSRALDRHQAHIKPRLNGRI